LQGGLDFDLLKVRLICPSGIHDRYGLALPAYAVGLALMVFAGFLATIDRRAENVIVKAIVIPKLELCNVKWQVFGANLVERAHDAALENAPEAFNGLGVDSADNA
jgi:hypothetical protein